LVSVTLYVEGGGHRQLDAELRRAFQLFLTANDVVQRPRVVASGSRQSAYSDFCGALSRGEQAYLLVDAEAPVAAAHALGNAAQWLPWAHLQQRDGWARPKGATDLQCHLMVECMENWFLADATLLAAYFGKGFQAKQLPKPGGNVEALGKSQVLKGLLKATHNCDPKGVYSKGGHSFKLLSLLDPAKLLPLAPWAERFVQTLR